MTETTFQTEPADLPDIRFLLRNVPCILSAETPLLQLSDLPQDAWTLEDAYTGVLVFGSTGSGKSSGSGRALAHAFLSSGMGGLVLCEKSDEADTWMQYAAETGRRTDMIRFSPNGTDGFNFLDYELRRSPEAVDVQIGNVVNLLLNTLDMASRSNSMSTPSAGDAFWIKSARMVLNYAIQLLYATTGSVRLAELVELIESAPKTTAQISDEAWQKRSFFSQIFRDFYATGGGRYPPDLEDVKRLKHFWLTTFPDMPEKTRGNIITTLNTDLDPLLQGRMRRLFSGNTTLIPEMTHDGAVIVMDFPVKEWGDAGLLAQQIFKYAWQRSTERRAKTDTTRPVFLFADECQSFLSAYDMKFQATARSSRACTVLMTQNLPSFYSTIGGTMPEHTVNALLGNLRTKIFHANDDQTTNQWASRMVGKETFWRENFGTSTNHSESFSEGRNTGQGESWSVSSAGQTSSSLGGSWNRGTSTGSSTSSGSGTSRGVSEQRDYAVEPEDFAKELKNGGKRNGYLVTGVIMQVGRTFARNRKHWMQVGFDQR